MKESFCSWTFRSFVSLLLFHLLSLYINCTEQRGIITGYSHPVVVLFYCTNERAETGTYRLYLLYIYVTFLISFLSFTCNLGGSTSTAAFVTLKSRLDGLSTVIERGKEIE